MKWIKMFKKSKKGSVTLMVLTTMMFVLLILTASYFAISNKSRDQDKKISQIVEQYRASDEDMEQEYINTLNSLTKLTMEQAQSDGMFEKTTNTEVTDGYGNKIVVPTGFKITDDATDVTQGVVIEDKDGNQFVWIPVGTIYTNVNKTESAIITLDRYTFDSEGKPTAHGTDVIDSYCQELSESSYGNATAKDLNSFLESVSTNRGYYIGRYEAGTDTQRTSNLDTLIAIKVQEDKYVYNYVTQEQASSLSQKMYENNSFTSDLMNSYAWDTAIVFIQEFSGNTNYQRQTGLNQSELVNTGKASNGTYYDVKCNIYDMASNCYEWTTENDRHPEGRSLVRGGHYLSTFFNTSTRSGFAGATYSDICCSFRPLLYLE